MRSNACSIRKRKKKRESTLTPSIYNSSTHWGTTIIEIGPPGVRVHSNPLCGHHFAYALQGEGSQSKEWHNPGSECNKKTHQSNEWWGG